MVTRAVESGKVRFRKNILMSATLFTVTLFINYTTLLKIMKFLKNLFHLAFFSKNLMGQFT